jgi:hypothetical protein
MGSDGMDIVAKLEQLAFYAERVIEDEHYGKRLILAEGVADVVHEAMDEIVDLRAQLFNEQEARKDGNA